MKMILGIAIGVLYAVLAGLAFGTSRGGWAAGHDDLGFWWAFIGTLLALAGLAAVFGSWVHTRPVSD
jgi:hypothetical protein